MISRRRGHTATYHIRAANTNVGVEPRVEQHAELAVLADEGPEVQVAAKPIQPRRDEAPHRRRQGHRIVKDGKVAVDKPLPATMVPHPTILRPGGHNR